jgi:hypothetical protein
MLITGRLQAAPLPLPERQARAALGGGRVDVRVRRQSRAQANRLRDRPRDTVTGTDSSGFDSSATTSEDVCKLSSAIPTQTATAPPLVQQLAHCPSWLAATCAMRQAPWSQSCAPPGAHPAPLSRPCKGSRRAAQAAAAPVHLVHNAAGALKTGRRTGRACPGRGALTWQGTLLGRAGAPRPAQRSRWCWAPCRR